ncbi:MAG: phenylacetate-CoA oxygenase subunit PaaJ [Pseudonocardia sp.]|nr:phenylacetate-CoA oxygenase subunit PaaJ [Pseudonocardia sp.]
MVSDPRPDVFSVVASVIDPELPVLTLGDLGVIRAVEIVGGPGEDCVVVTITPTYPGCPAHEVIRADLRASLVKAGYPRVRVRTVLSPAWSTDWISEQGRRKLAEAGIAPPGQIGACPRGTVPLTLAPHPLDVRCPRCDEPRTEELSAFGPTPCTALRRCSSCREPFEYLRER